MKPFWSVSPAAVRTSTSFWTHRVSFNISRHVIAAFWERFWFSRIHHIHLGEGWCNAHHHQQHTKCRTNIAPRYLASKQNIAVWKATRLDGEITFLNLESQFMRYMGCMEQMFSESPNHYDEALGMLWVTLSIAREKDRKTICDESEPNSAWIFHDTSILFIVWRGGCTWLYCIILLKILSHTIQIVLSSGFHRRNHVVVARLLCVIQMAILHARKLKKTPCISYKSNLLAIICAFLCPVWDG